MPATIMAFGSIAVLIIGALGTQIINIRTAWRVEEKVDTIKKSVDGAASASVAKIEGLQSKVESLHEIIADKRETVAILSKPIISKD